MPTVELLLRPSITAPHRCAARNTSQPAADPLRLMVTTLPPPVYTPSFTITVSPGLVTSAACCNVRQGAALVPALASLPAAPPPGSCANVCHYVDAAAGNDVVAHSGAGPGRWGGRDPD